MASHATEVRAAEQPRGSTGRRGGQQACQLDLQVQHEDVVQRAVVRFGYSRTVLAGLRARPGAGGCGGIRGPRSREEPQERPGTSKPLAVRAHGRCVRVVRGGGRSKWALCEIRGLPRPISARPLPPMGAVLSARAIRARCRSRSPDRLGGRGAGSAGSENVEAPRGECPC